MVKYMTRLNESWNAMSDLIKENKYNPAGPGREVYLLGPSQETDPVKYRMSYCGRSCEVKKHAAHFFQKMQTIFQ